MKSSSPAKPRTKPNLDLIDRKILSILRDEGRLTVNELASRVGLSSSPCWSRVRHLEEIGVIKHYAAVIDHSAIGLKDIVFIEVTLDKHDDKALARSATPLQGSRKLSRPTSSPATTIIWSRWRSPTPPTTSAFSARSSTGFKASGTRDRPFRCGL